MRHAAWSAASRRDLRRAFDYYKVLDADLALRIVETIEAKGDWLAEFPFTGSPLRGRLRKSLVAGTPYLIVYRPASTGIIVGRVFHAKQNWR
ncbi:MAG: type II toxin-antitoxin system RelE/ParE family toxin [Sphingomonadaceae bacterium]|nr:type II toxin-antitoxin system RelE/ParE family toxin [Sphingomonadaceae bacterium]